jgi:hypothetical protein
MTLKVKRTEIQDSSSINFGATIMGGAVVESKTTILPLSLVLKEMYLPTAAYEGSPSEQVRNAPGSVRHDDLRTRERNTWTTGRATGSARRPRRHKLAREAPAGVRQGRSDVHLDHDGGTGS